MKVLSEKNVSPTQVLNTLREADEEELSRRQRTALEHLRKHVAVEDEGTWDELMGELEDLDKFNTNQIIKIIELLPETEQEVRALFSKERIKLDDDDIDRVLSFTDSVSA